MKWKVETSKKAEKFLAKNPLGKIRIIAEFRFEDSVVFVEEIDWRGNIY